MGQKNVPTTPAPVTPSRIAPRPAEPGKLRIAFVMYRGHPQVGGQGVYARALTRELVQLGHSVEVFSGPPWPELDDGVGFTPVPGLDLYREPTPFRTPARSEVRSLVDVLEFFTMKTGGFGEPWTFGKRLKAMLQPRRDEFDLIHDNQCLATGVADLYYDGWPVLETLHHPITVDRRIALSHATNWIQRYGVRRWYHFLTMQKRVAQQLPAIVTVSHNSLTDIQEQLGVDPKALTVVPVGVDTAVFRPYDDVSPLPGRIMVTTSSDVAMKGLVPLLEAIALLRQTRDVDLVVVGRPKEGGAVAQAIERLQLTASITTVAGISTEEMARRYGEAEVAVIPSLYEGFSLPAIEAMACGVAVVATTGGALPEVVGPDAALLVRPNDPVALAEAIGTLLDDPERRRRMGQMGRARVERLFTWAATARDTVTCYNAVVAGTPLPPPVTFH